ncbi:hypothetical protein IFM12276_56010 [Nocardia sputorum]|uniref:Uncharacterized protein n=1 Tax=Nocardia sputorum TaxID=2984338 RepID=A0ABM8D5F4_9NOCA|nr:hypothetical protein IFM12276_56010 [Nocardia sputorum]
MHHHRHHVVGGADLGQRHPQRHFRRDIETGQREAAQPRGQLVFGDGLRREVGDGRSGGQHHLIPRTIHRRIHRPQRLMTPDHIRDRRPQRRHIQHTRQPHRERNIIPRRTGIELIQKPHPPLRQRQRHPLRTLHRHQRVPVTGALQRLQPRGQRGDGGALEDQPGGHPRRDGRAEPGGDLRRDQRIAAQLEEIVVRADRRTGTEQLGEHLADQLFQRTDRRTEYLGL